MRATWSARDAADARRPGLVLRAFDARPPPDGFGAPAITSSTSARSAAGAAVAGAPTRDRAHRRRAWSACREGGVLVGGEQV
ncbi:hypothetical protein NGM37_43240, partial [Streptomyces sp. TRM76130]|nr:hypothetical protein [Streptomyces sp. TRM76130]